MTQYAIMLNAGTDDVGPTANGLEYALDLDAAGHDVEVFLDGVATTWPGTLAKKPDHPVNDYFETATERGLIAGACRFCADAFGGTDGVEAAGIDLIGEEGEHGPNVGDLATAGYTFLTVG
ncbi:MAG: hypothetical protein ACLFM8_06355 [Halobacteriales archaeon]